MPRLVDVMDNSHTYHSPQLQQLIEKSGLSNWSISEFDWDQTPIVPNDVTITDYVDMISQLYHAELFTLKICARLITKIPDFQALRFICTQMNDEARHADVYAKYIQLLGEIAPVNERLADIFSKTLAWTGSYCGLIVALNVVMESEALNQQRKRIETLPCPIFKAINSRIIQDEARHSGFGFIYMRDKLPLLSEIEKNNIITWIEGLWSDWKLANEDRYLETGAAILRTSPEELDIRLKAQQRMFCKLGLVTSPHAVTEEAL